MSQKKNKDPEFKTLGSALGGAMTDAAPRTSLTTRQPEHISSAVFSARSERMHRLVEWVEMAVQIKLDPEQRAHIIVELVELELPEVIYNCAAYIIAGGWIEVFGRLDMAIWRKAIEQVPHQVGKTTKFYRQGWNDGQNALWRNLRMGSHNDELRRILEETQS